MPARLRDLKRALVALGCTVTTNPSGSSHYMARKGNDKYPLPCHNGEKTELSDVYVRGVCRQLGLDEAELRKLL